MVDDAPNSKPCVETFMRPDVGVVVIGRNEGERLKRCLDSVRNRAKSIVYVDSGSTDGSVALAASTGMEVLILDTQTPFTAARARNAGFKRLQLIAPQVTFVQFVDGDCEINDGWIQAAASFLGANPKVACVCGRLRERFPERSVYNRLCDDEWNRPTGQTDACGGIAMMDVAAFEAVGGFDDTLIVGEEPELCLRIRAAGRTIWRMSTEMAWHDADMQRLTQWWRRAMRGGYAAAEGTVRFGGSATTSYASRLWKTVLWSLVLPLAICVLSVLSPWSILFLGVYPLQVTRLVLRSGSLNRENWTKALFQVLAKFPEVAGAVKYLLDRLLRRHGRLIEYR